MMKVSMLLPLFAIVASANAQEGTDFNSTPKTVDPEPLKRNEISINTAPVFRMLLGAGSSEATRFSATYKRNLNCNSALRFSIMADMISENYYKDNSYAVILLESDSVLIKQTTITPGYLSPHVNVGYERLFGKNKLKWFYGADLLLGYSESRTAVQNQTLHKDTAQGPNAWVVVHEFGADIVSKTKTKAYSVGISPFFGAKFPISKRLSVSAQVGADMTFKNMEVKETKNGLTNKQRVTSFDFSQSTGILNDISLVYKF